MIHAAIYPRQSVEKKDSLSIEQQVQSGINLCNLKGWTYTVYDKDKGYSGKNLNRPSFEAMMKDVRAGKIQRIICYRFDRISRNISDFSNLVVELQNYNCEFVSISENFDTSSPIGRAMVYICMVFAQMERESISERVRDNYYYRMDLGFWGGGPAPYGYQLARIAHKGQSHTVLEPDPETANIVRQIYEWYLEPGGSAGTILRRLNMQLRIPSKNGSQWTSRVLTDILTRPSYAPNDMKMYNYLIESGAKITNEPAEFDGSLSIDLYGKKNVRSSKHKRCRSFSDMYCNVSNHRAIVDSDTWIMVQRKYQQQAIQPRRSGTGRHSYFTGLMKCSCCGLSVSYTNSRGTAGYYICGSRKNRGWDSCPAPIFPKKQTDDAILESILLHYQDDAVLQRLHTAKFSFDTGDASAAVVQKRNDLLSELAGVEKSIDNLITTLQSSPEITARYINDRLAKLDADKNRIELSLASLNQVDLSVDEDKLKLQRIEDCISAIPDILNTGDFDAIKNLCAVLVKKISFCEDGSIKITYAI